MSAEGSMHHSGHVNGRNKPAVGVVGVHAVNNFLDGEDGLAGRLSEHKLLAALLNDDVACLVALQSVKDGDIRVDGARHD